MDKNSLVWDFIGTIMLLVQVKQILKQRNKLIRKDSIFLLKIPISVTIYNALMKT